MSQISRSSSGQKRDGDFSLLGFVFTQQLHPKGLNTIDPQRAQKAIQ